MFQDHDSESEVKVSLQKCNVCKEPAWRLFAVNSPAGGFVDGFAIVRRICLRCRRKYQFIEKGLGSEAVMMLPCAICVKDIPFARDGSCLLKGIRNCVLCGKCFCPDCHRISSMSLCINSDKSHYIQYAVSY